MSQDTEPNRCVLKSARVKMTPAIIKAFDALEGANPGLSVSDNQVFNTLIERGARALLTDLEFGAELPMGPAPE